MTFGGKPAGAGGAEACRREEVGRARSPGVARAWAVGEAFGARLDRATALTTGRFFSPLPGLVRARVRLGVEE